MSENKEYQIGPKANIGHYHLNAEEKAYIAAGAGEDGIIPIEEYIRRTTYILRRSHCE